MSAKTPAKKADPATIAAAVADQIFATIATDIYDVGDWATEVNSPLFDHFYPTETSDDLLYPVFERLQLSEDVADRKAAIEELRQMIYDAREAYRQMGYLLGIQVGRRMAGGAR